MTRRKKLLRNLAIVLTALVAVVFVGAIAIVQSDWFRAYVRQKIITATEEGTGGKVEIGSFTFDWRHLRAAVSDFVVHGTESPGVAPYLRASQVQLIIRPLTSVHHFLDLTYLAIDHPEANIIVFPDGHTNVPTPKGPSSSKSPLETVVDLAVSRFELTNGMITFASEKQQLDVRGNNLHVQLFYNVADRGYHGQLSFEPIYVVSGRNTPVTLAVTLPVALGRDRVTIQDARITTPHSSIVINGSLNTLRGRPTVSANVKGRIALADLENAGALPVDVASNGVPTNIDVDANATVENDRIQVIGLHLSLGQSNVEASGTLKDPRGEGALDFKSRLAIGEIGRLAKISNRPEGIAILNGRAKLDANNNYRVDGNAQITDVSFQTGARRFSNLSLFSAVSLDSHQLSLSGLRLLAFGGELQGDVSVQEFARYQLRLNARNLDLQAIARMTGQSRFAYGGIVSGPLESSGSLKTAPQGVVANARLTIAPGSRGIPVSGRLYASYDGARNDVHVDNSLLSLPHTRLMMNGSLASQLNIALTTSDPNDLLAAVPGTSKSPVAFVGGQASFTGTVSGTLSYPQVTGHLAANRFSIEGRQFEKLDADAQVSSMSAALRNGSVTRDKMQAQFGATVGLLNWEPTPSQPLTAEATIQNGDLADIAVLAGQQGVEYSGMLNANLRVDGTVGNPKGAGTLQIMNGTISGQPFDRIQAQIDLSDQVITIPSATVQSGPSNVQLTAEFRHPRDSFTVGEGRAHVQSNQVDLSQLPGLQKVRPNTGGLVQLNADIAGRLSAGGLSTGQVANDAQHGKQQTEFLLTSVTADAAIRGLRSGSQTYGDLTLNARTSEETVSYNLVSNFAGSNIRVNGNTRLKKGFPTTADATLSNLVVERVLALAQRTDIPVKGSLSGTAHLSGTTDQPEGNAELELANAMVYEEPVDRLRSRVVYRNQTIEVPQLEIVSGPSHLDLTARYDHPSENLQSGNLQFRVNDSRIDLSRIKNLQNRRPGLAGALQIAASGAAEIRSFEPRVLIHDVNAMVKASGISAQGKQFGDLDLNANTSAGKLNFVLDSNLAEASIHGRGTAVLNSDYPVDAQLQFSNVTWTKLQPLLGGSGGPPTFEAVSDGQVNVRGPATKVEQLDGSLQISRVRVSTVSRNSKTPGLLLLENQGPISAAMNQGIVRIQSAHLRGSQTDFQATGTIPLRGQSMDLKLNGNVNLAVLQSLSEDVTSSGSAMLDANVHGTISAPLVNGQVELQNATLNYIDFPNGISNANGLVQFNGNSATLRNMTAESGGGKLTVAGFAAMRDELRFGLRVNASDVRVRVQQGVSVIGNGNVNLTGTSRNSVLSGAMTISRLNYAPQTDLGSMLVQVAPPVQSPSVSSPILDNMKLDIQIRTTGGTSVQSSLAENLLLDTDLQVRGTATHPGVLGRVNVTNGELVFFGSKYAVESGSIGFFNPVRIEPILDLTLHTQAKGVDVVLRATGPVDNIKLSYTSDPPLQFQEIVTLLAAGKTPTSDPTLLAKQPSQPAQNFQQMGATALLSKAVADPVANRLQRVFGVSQLKIDPTFTSGSDLPQAQVTVQQQVTSNLTFTYATGLTDANAQTVRVELTLNPQWSASAMRDQNGIFSINLLYKRQLR